MWFETSTNGKQLRKCDSPDLFSGGCDSFGSVEGKKATVLMINVTFEILAAAPEANVENVLLKIPKCCIWPMCSL